MGDRDRTAMRDLTGSEPGPARRLPAAGPAPRTRRDTVDELWLRYKHEADASARNGLILHYSALVKFVAGRIGSALPATVEPQDLVSYGTFGLIDAIERFQPERGFRFETYAVNRIRGAIIDELRRLDWVPRAVRTRARHIQDALAELEHRLQRTATEEEVAAYMGIDVDRLRDDLAAAATGGVVAIEDLVGGDGSPIGELLADPAAADPFGAVEAEEVRRLLVDTISRLPERERHVVTLYYFEAMTLSQIAEIVGVTESRISQIHAKAVLSLRNRLVLAGRA